MRISPKCATISIGDNTENYQNTSIYIYLKKRGFYMKFLILFLIALVISAMGFIKFVWFISLGYGFSIAGLGIAILAMFSDDFTFTTLALTLLLIVYGCRLGSYLLIRERNSASYQKTMKNDIKDGSGMNFFLKLIIWISCAFLYCCEVSPVFFRMENAVKPDAVTVIGLIIMACGIILESAADLIKNIYKNVHPDHFCNVGLFRFVRCLLLCLPFISFDFHLYLIFELLH